MKKLHEYEDWPTTKRFPRSLAEAFPQDQTGDWWERHKRPHNLVPYVLTLLALGLLLKVVL